MAALAAAWRLSEPGWRQELEAITVYQRGWRLGGKGASSRGPNGRIEEHGLHLWLGYYENSFRLLRECYAERDRPRTDPAAPIRTWREAMLPAGTVGLEDRRRDGWHHWLGQFTSNELEPGGPEAGGRELSVVEVLRRALQLIADFLESLADEQLPSGALAMSGSSDPPQGPSSAVTALRVGVRRSRAYRQPTPCWDARVATEFPGRCSADQETPPLRRPESNNDTRRVFMLAAVRR